MPPVLGIELLVVVQVLIFPHIPYCFILRPARDLRSGRWHHRTDAVLRSLARKPCHAKEAAHHMRLQKGNWPRGSVKYVYR